MTAGGALTLFLQLCMVLFVRQIILSHFHSSFSNESFFVLVLVVIFKLF